MEFFELVKTVEVEVPGGMAATSCRVEVLRSNQNKDIYRINLMELRGYNMYPVACNTGPDGSDLHHFHSADQVWYEVPVVPYELYTGFTAISVEEALQQGLHAFQVAYSHA